MSGILAAGALLEVGKVLRAARLEGMEDWVYRALKRWPNVPALFGWLSLDRRGRWRILGEIISRPQITETIDRNYAADEQGRWYFQNGPQRGYVKLEYAPFVLRTAEWGEQLVTHSGLPVASISGAYLDEEGALTLATEHGPGVLEDEDLPWAVERLRNASGPLEEDDVAAALALPSKEKTALVLQVEDAPLAVMRLDSADLPGALGFVRDPQQ